MNDITNTVNNGMYRGSRVPTKPVAITTSPTRSSRSNQHITMGNPPALQPQDSFSSTLSKTQYQQRLRQKRSRIDMLDQQLTSFPLAPPPAKDHQKVSEILRSPDIDAQELDSSANNSQISEIDPIVLVEDYVPHRNTRKKLSVSDLKQSLKNFEISNFASQDNYLTRAKSILETRAELNQNKNHNLSTPSQSMLRQVSNSNSLLLTNTVSSTEATSFPELTSSKSTAFFSAKTSQSPQEPFELAQFDFPHVGPTYASSRHTIGSITSTLPTLKLTDEFDTPTAEFSTRDTRLKSCVICETPLYDISSHCGDRDYVEFVCCNCTEKYEMLSKLVDSFDEAVSSLSCIPEDVEDIEEALMQPAVKRQRNDLFSKTLVDGLKRQLNGEVDGVMDRTSARWLLEARKKLRWRWRMSGLLPQFMKRKN